jgi:Meiotically up-regulated gene 113
MYIYIIGNAIDKQKIGFTNDVVTRLKTLQTGNPDHLTIHHFEEVPASRVRLLERKIHKELNHKRIKGEWFNISPNEAKLSLQHAIIRWLDDPLL